MEEKVVKEVSQENHAIKEKIIKKKGNGMFMLLLLLVLFLGAIALTIIGVCNKNLLFIIPGAIYIPIGFILFFGIKILKPNEAMVLILFGEYLGTIKESGIYYLNPFSHGINPAGQTKLGQSDDVDGGKKGKDDNTANYEGNLSRISLKKMTLSNAKQKVNDVLGNPVEIGVAVIWEVSDTAKAVFNVDNYKEYLSLQVDSAVRDIVKIYPYDVAKNVDTTGDGEPDDGSLRGSTVVVAKRIEDMIQEKVEQAGLHIVEARITYLAYAPEIASAMLQRQQASALIDAKKMIVDGAVGMVEMALKSIEENGNVKLDEERKAAMVSNLLVVLCGNHDAKPVVNAGSLY